MCRVNAVKYGWDNNVYNLDGYSYSYPRSSDRELAFRYDESTCMMTSCTLDTSAVAMQCLPYRKEAGIVLCWYSLMLALRANECRANLNPAGTSSIENSYSILAEQHRVGIATISGAPLNFDLYLKPSICFNVINFSVHKIPLGWLV